MGFFSRLFKRKVDVAKMREAFYEQKEYYDEWKKEGEKKREEDLEKIVNPEPPFNWDKMREEATKKADEMDEEYRKEPIGWKFDKNK